MNGRRRPRAGALWRINGFAIAAVACLLFAAANASAYCSTIGLDEGRRVAEIQTGVGELCIELLDGPDEAPGHVENFLYYLERGDLDGTFFHRLVDDFVIQGGQWELDAFGKAQAVPVRPGVEVTNEPCTVDLPESGPPAYCSVRGNALHTVALAKRSGLPDSGTTSWFINLADNRTNLDSQNGGFTVFGRLIHSQSFATADQMAAMPIATLEDHYWMDTGWAYDWREEGGQFYRMPSDPVPLVEAPPPWSRNDLGCLDMEDQATLLLEEYLPGLVADPDDPETPRPAFHITSAACGEPVEDPIAWLESRGQGTPSCVEPDRLAVRSTTPPPTASPDDLELPQGRVPAQYVSLTCEQLRDADALRAEWRGGFDDLLVEIESSVVRVAVPEPSGLASAFFALACLGWLRLHANG